MAKNITDTEIKGITEGFVSSIEDMKAKGEVKAICYAVVGDDGILTGVTGKVRDLKLGAAGICNEILAEIPIPREITAKFLTTEIAHIINDYLDINKEE